MKLKLSKQNKVLAIFAGVLILVVFALSFLIWRGMGPRYSTITPEQMEFLDKLHPSVQNTFKTFVEKVQRTGWTVIFTSGCRTVEKQVSLYAENPKNARPGYSRHNFGFAIDINLKKDGKHVRKASSVAEWKATGAVAIAKALGMKWGGDFQNYHDPVHFTVPEPDISTLRAKAEAQFGSVEATGNRSCELRL